MIYIIQLCDFILGRIAERDANYHDMLAHALFSLHHLTREWMTDLIRGSHIAVSDTVCDSI